MKNTRASPFSRSSKQKVMERRPKRNLKTKPLSNFGAKDIKSKRQKCIKKRGISYPQQNEYHGSMKAFRHSSTSTCSL